MGPLEPGEVKDYIHDGMQAAREAVHEELDELTLSEEMLDSWNDLDDQADEPGTTHIMSALLACADAPNGLSGEVLFGVLCFCYEAVRERFEDSVEGLEAELESAECVSAISFQKERIAAALASLVQLLGVRQEGDVHRVEILRGTAEFAGRRVNAAVRLCRCRPAAPAAQDLLVQEGWSNAPSSLFQVGLT